MQGHHGATTSPCGQPRGPSPAATQEPRRASWQRGLGSLWTGSNRQGRRPPPCEESQATSLSQTRQNDVTASDKTGGPSETQSPYRECVQAPRIPLVTPERGDLEPIGKKDSSRGRCGTGTMLDEQVDPNNAPASSQASLTSSGERHLSRGQRHAGGEGGEGRYPATLQDPRDTTARSQGSRAQNRALTGGQRPRRPERAHGPDRGEAHSGHTGMTGGCPRLGQGHTPTDFRS